MLMESVGTAGRAYSPHLDTRNRVNYIEQAIEEGDAETLKELHHQHAYQKY